MAQSQYANLGKDELSEAVKARRAAGRTIKADLRNEDSMRAGLESDDLENGEFDPAKEPAPKAETKKLSGDLTNQVVKQPEAPVIPTQPAEDVFAKKGFLARNKQDGLLYQVVKDPADDVKPYKARVPKQESGHPGFFWEGSADEYNATFEKA